MDLEDIKAILYDINQCGSWEVNSPQWIALNKAKSIVDLYEKIENILGTENLEDNNIKLQMIKNFINVENRYDGKD